MHKLCVFTVVVLTIVIVVLLWKCKKKEKYYDCYNFCELCDPFNQTSPYCIACDLCSINDPTNGNIN